MNSHADIQKRLSAYCSGDMNATEKAEIDAHLAACTLCRIHLAEMQTTLRLIRSTPEVEAPAWMKSRIMARLREEQATRRTWLQRIWFPLHTGMPVKVLALLVMCVSGYYLSRSVDTELKIARQQQLQEQPAQSAPAPQPIPAQKPAETTAPQKAEPPSQQPQTQRKESTQAIQAPSPTTAVPLPAPAASPAAPEASQPSYAPPQPTAKGFFSGKSEAAKPAPASDVTGRLRDVTSEAKKSRRSQESNFEYSAPAAERAAGAPASPPLPRQTVRMTVHNRELAPALIRDAVSRTGGTISEDLASAQRRYKILLPAERQKELLDRLQVLGRITERPVTPPPGTTTVEMTIQW